MSTHPTKQTSTHPTEQTSTHPTEQTCPKFFHIGELSSRQFCFSPEIFILKAIFCFWRLRNVDEINGILSRRISFKKCLKKTCRPLIGLKRRKFAFDNFCFIFGFNLATFIRQKKAKQKSMTMINTSLATVSRHRN